jgi:arsenate reductase
MHAVIESAGSQPSQVNPFAAQVLRECGIDISSHYSKTVDSLSSKFLSQLDLVVTLCAEEVCPLLVSKAKRFHWPLPDPGKSGTSDDKLRSFRSTRDTIRERLIIFKAKLMK